MDSAKKCIFKDKIGPLTFPQAEVFMTFKIERRIKEWMINFTA